MKTIIPGELPTAKLHAYMLASVAPRPICFASTIDQNGEVNLSPYSFFNAFGSNPPTLVFSPARRVRDNTIKHTLENIYQTMEVCINVVTYDMVWQTSLASTEYPKGVNEFVKAGFTPLASDLIKAPRVKESPVQIECKVNQIIETGDQGGAGNLIICEILKMHIDERVLNEQGMIDQNKIQLVARLGADWYCKAFGPALFEIEKPLQSLGIGVDKLPELIKNSDVLTGNNLGQLANVQTLPTDAELQQFKANDPRAQHLIQRFSHHPESFEYEKHLLAKDLLKHKDLQTAWKVLLLN